MADIQVFQRLWHRTAASDLQRFKPGESFHFHVSLMVPSFSAALCLLPFALATRSSAEADAAQLEPMAALVLCTWLDSTLLAFWSDMFAHFGLEGRFDIVCLSLTICL